MSLEQKISQQLNKYPLVKKSIKSMYQHTMYAVMPKIKAEGEIVRLSPDDLEHEYFFGYYDKSPWDVTERYVLCLKAKNTWMDAAPKETADILLIDTKQQNNVKKIACTSSWNVQQGCMLQWLGPGFGEEIIYNDFRGCSFCSVVLNVFNGKEGLLDMPVYSVSEDGKTALTLDFARLHRLRQGYGYSNIPERTHREKLPDSTCIWKIDIHKNEIKPLLRYTDFAGFEPRTEMENAEHKVNHIMISPGGKRFMVIHRWFKGKRKYSRLLTCGIDGGGMYNLSDDGMVSHCCWKDDNTILAFENKAGRGAGYYEMKDRTQEYRRLWPGINADGHPSYSPDRKLVVTDTYPDKSRVSSIKVMSGEGAVTLVRVFSPFKYDNDTRCDLHPRWSRTGGKICFDSAFEGHRGLYYTPINL